MTSVVSSPASHRSARPFEVVPDATPERERATSPELDEPSGVTRREALIVAAHGLTLFGLLIVAFVAYLVGVSALEHGRSQRALRTAFHQDVEFGNAWVGGRIPEGSPVAELSIAKLGVREVVAEGTAGAVLRHGPGHLRTAVLPGQAGNAVIAGRRVSYGGPFRHLDELAAGDQIITTTGQGRAVYRVSGVREISRHDRDAIDDFGDNRLTLITSAPEYKASRRLVVTATLSSAPHPLAAALPTDIRKAELGLNSDRATAYGLLLWAQALLAASVAAAWIRRRWRRWPTYLVAMPVLALLILLVFDNLTPVLPSTL